MLKKEEASTFLFTAVKKLQWPPYKFSSACHLRRKSPQYIRVPGELKAPSAYRQAKRHY